MNFLSLLFVILLTGHDFYKIEFENGNGHLKLESNAVVDGKIVQEPKVEQVIKKLSGVRYKEPHNEMTKIKHRQHPEVQHKPVNGNKKDNVKVEYNDYDIPRVFITNINKNVNANDNAYDETEEQHNYNIEKKPHNYHRNLAAKQNQTTTAKSSR